MPTHSPKQQAGRRPPGLSPRGTQYRRPLQRVGAPNFSSAKREVGEAVTPCATSRGIVLTWISCRPSIPVMASSCSQTRAALGGEDGADCCGDQASQAWPLGTGPARCAGSAPCILAMRCTLCRPRVFSERRNAVQTRRARCRRRRSQALRDAHRRPRRRLETRRGGRLGPCNGWSLEREVVGCAGVAAATYP